MTLAEWAARLPPGNPRKPLDEAWRAEVRDWMRRAGVEPPPEPAKEGEGEG